jgi:two-component system, OmpR family, phosphate regulon sensor histidine kinase PhoR
MNETQGPPSTAGRLPAVPMGWAGLCGLSVAGVSALMGTAAGLPPVLVAASCGLGGVVATLAVLAILLRRRAETVAAAQAASAPQTPAPGALPPILEAALDAAPVPVLLLWQGGRILQMNAAARDRFPLASPGGRVEAMVRQPDLVAAIAASFADGRMRQVALTSLVPLERFERATIAPFEDSGARHVLMTVADETEQRASERMRADFLANASHELRTPLASIAGFIETLRGPARDDAEARERFLKIMDDQAGRMSRLLTDLSSLSRIELFERVAPTGTVDLGLVVRETVEASPSAALVELAVPDGPLPVLADRDQLVQVVTNLVDNAVKYGGGQPVRVRVAARLEREPALQAAGRQWTDAFRLPLTSPGHEPGRLYAVLRVEDQGPGIAREALPRLTERFYRVEATARGVPGTGLGLAIVKHIVNRHRGGLLVESRPGQGTSFAVYLPQPLASASPAPAITATAVPGTAASA